jgi:hypothetical protein
MNMNMTTIETSPYASDDTFRISAAAQPWVILAYRDDAPSTESFKFA